MNEIKKMRKYIKKQLKIKKSDIILLEKRKQEYLIMQLIKQERQEKKK